MPHRSEVTDEVGVVLASADMIAKLRKILELSKRAGTEGEAAAASFRLQELLTKYNLEVADLELKTGKVAHVGEAGYDLAKSGFKWKLDLADYVADHYYCAPIVDRRSKTVMFVGRPDNVESLRMLYGWLIDQIAALAREARREHAATTGVHIDPLRWQLGFGEGAALRISQRLDELRRSFVDEDTTALVVHHQVEVSDYLEDKYGYRRDGRETKRARQSREEYERIRKEREELKSRCAFEGNMEPYYRKYPWERPLTAEQRAQQDKADREYMKRQARNEKRRTGRSYWKDETDEERRQRHERRDAKEVGFAQGDKVNLTPFIEGHVDNKKKVKP